MQRKSDFLSSVQKSTNAVIYLINPNALDPKNVISLLGGIVEKLRKARSIISVHHIVALGEQALFQKT